MKKTTRAARTDLSTIAKFARVLRYVLRQKRTLSLIFICTLVSSLVAAVLPLPTKILVDSALGDQPVPAVVQSILEAVWLTPTPATLIAFVAVASLFLFAVSSLLNAVLSLGWTAAGQRMVYDVAADLFDRLQRLSLTFHRKRSVGDSLSRLSGDTYCLYSVTEGVLFSPIQSLVTLVTVGTFAFHLDPILAMLSFAVAPFLAASAVFFGPHLKRRSRKQREVQSRLLSFVHQTLTAMPVVQAFGTEKRNRQQFQTLATDIVTASQRGQLLMSFFGFVNGLTATVGTAFVLYVGGVSVLAGATTVGSLIVFIAYLTTLQAALKQFMGVYGTLKSAEASVDRLLEILDSDDLVENRADALPLGPRSPSTGRYVGFENVTFGYETGRPVLQGVTVEAMPGETLALVGSSGAGKSTLASALSRCFDVWGGRVTVDGNDVRDLELSSLRSQISMVLQEPFLLPLTIRENIAYGRPDATEEEIVQAAVAANADEFIRELPGGYDCILGEKGATLSGGQKQRLAIARALLKDAPILILDEPTSALDSRTEGLIMEALTRLMKGRTTLLIAHRLSTVQRADRIAVLDGGRVVEIGTHEQLLMRRGAYHSLHAAQLATSRGQVA